MTPTSPAGPADQTNPTAPADHTNLATPAPSAPAWRDALEPFFVTLDSTDKNWTAAMALLDGALDIPAAALSTPSLTVDVDALSHNVATMQEWMSRHGVSFAPHGKTTMAPALWNWQLAAGAWAITVANEPQLRVARAAGIPRVIVANEYLSPQGLAWLAGELDADAGFEVTCWVDSLDAVAQMTRHLAAAGATRPLQVCVEVGAAGARTGARSAETARAVAEAVVASPALTLMGVAGYEGSVPAPDEAAKVVAVRGFLARMADTFRDLRGLFETSAPLLSAGGSAYFDLVVEAFAPVREADPAVRVVLRSGSYIVHDDGVYKTGTPSATRSGPHLVAAAHIFSRVLSVPEPGLALLDVGRRDVPYDAGLPTIQEVLRDDGSGRRRSLSPPASVVRDLNDQHGYVDFTESAADADADVDADAGAGSLRVGDIVRLGLSHPCTIFDKWRSLLLVETASAGDDPGASGIPIIRGALKTYF